MDYTDEDLEKYRRQVPTAYQNTGVGAIATALPPTSSYAFGSGQTPIGGSPWVARRNGVSPVLSTGIDPAQYPLAYSHGDGYKSQYTTKAERQDAGNMSLADELNNKNKMWNNTDLAKYYAPTGGGSDTAIPWQSNTSPVASPDYTSAVPTDVPGLKNNIAMITSRLNDVQGRLGGKLKRSTRTALTVEAGQLLGALGQMFPMDSTQALNVGKLGVDQFKATSDAQLQATQGNYYNSGAVENFAKVGEYPSKRVLNIAQANHAQASANNMLTPAQQMLMRGNDRGGISPDTLLKVIAANSPPGTPTKTIMEEVDKYSGGNRITTGVTPPQGSIPLNKTIGGKPAYKLPDGKIWVED